MINLYDLLEAAGGQLFGEPAAHLFSQFCVDSRNATEACLYAAIKSERGDGHQYMQEAVERGATGLLCSRPPEFDTTGISVILVKNPLQALMIWSHFVVGKQGVRVIGVAGTSGKSVTLAAIKQVLRTRYNVLAAGSEQGGRLDIPLTLARLTPEHQIVALPLDVLYPGEMGEMVGAIRPHIGVISHVGPGYHERFDTGDQLTHEIGQLVDYISPTGLVILNYDDDYVRGLASRARAKVVTVSTEVAFGADIIAQNIMLDTARTGFDLRYNDQRIVGRWTPLLGKQQLTCALAALAVGAYFDIPLHDSLHALTELEPLPGRMKPLDGINGSIIIDDSYKADPWTTLASLDWLQAVTQDHGRAIFVFGDMDALGAVSQRSHRRVGQKASEFTTRLVTEGAEAAMAARAALDQGMTPEGVRTTYSIHDAVAGVIDANVTDQDVILIKGGARSRMELVVKALLKNADDAVMLARAHTSDSSTAIRPNRPSWVEIDLEAAAGNVRAIRSMIGSQVALFAVLKADAYGHGAVAMARTALQNGADYLAVANIHEALELRDAGINAPILALSYLPSEAARQAIQYQITATLYDLDLARAYDSTAREMGSKLRAHVKIDTGMGRMGVMLDKAVLLFRHLTKLNNLDIEGVYTHLSTADDDLDYASEQIRRFRDTIAPLRASGYSFRYIHAANSAGTLRGADFHFNAVRVGLAMYGLSPSIEVPVTSAFRPVMSWKTVIAQVKTLPAGHPIGYGNSYRTRGEERIAVLPVGYADGLRRAPQNPGKVLVHGEFAPIVGRVSMEKTTINVTDIPDVAMGDEVVLLGRQGDNQITAEDIAANLGTISYEVVTTILPRIPRR